MIYPWTLRLRSILGFIILATLLSLLIGSLADTQRISLDLDIAAPLSPPIPYWHGFVAAMGLMIPMGLRVRCRSQGIMCRILNAYLIVFLAQIVSELMLTPLFLRGISVFIGSLYSVFRLLQLWQSQIWITKVTPSPRWFRFFLWGLIVIWTINLLQFIGYRWPLLLR